MGRAVLRFCCCCVVLFLLARGACAERYLVLGQPGEGVSALPLAGGAKGFSYEPLGIDVVESDLDREALARANPGRLFVEASTPLFACGSLGAASEEPLSWHQALAEELQFWLPPDSVDVGTVYLLILDTGICLDHPDLARHLRPDLGFNVLKEADSGDVDDDNGHGTAVAGMAGGEVTGAWPGIAIVPVKVADETASSTLETFAAAFNGILARAIDPDDAFHGRRLVFNVSYSVTSRDDAESRALESFFTNLFDRFAEAGCQALFCFSAGNSAVDVAETMVFPASMSHPHLLSVAAVDREGRLADLFSNYGLTAVEVAAPGEHLVSTCADRSLYVEVRGTSFASPFLAGTAAALWAAHPGLEAYQIRNVLLNLTARPRWLSDHYRAPSDWIVPVIAGDALAFSALSDDLFVADCAGETPRALTVRPPLGNPEREPEEEPGAGDSEAAEGGGGCRGLTGPGSLVLFVPLFVFRRRGAGRR